MARKNAREGGFSLIELLAGVSIFAVLLAMLAPVAWNTISTFQSARCANSLRQLAAATHLYLADNNNIFFPYYEDLPGGARRWYFGLEANWSQGGAEGDREVQVNQSPLYPYLQSVGRVEICPAFPYGEKYWKPKFKGASFGYGYNIFLSPPTRSPSSGATQPMGISLGSIGKPSTIALFGDCAQVNDFQPPASSAKPLLEEFYVMDDTSKTIHFRHGGKANILFVDGHVEAFKPCEGTLDTRIEKEIIGRFTPRRSTEYLKP